MLVESPTKPTIGVGESTLLQFNEYLNYLDWLSYKDHEWMPHCQATYKLSIKFTDWTRSGSAYHYPFGKIDVANTAFGVFDWYMKKALYPETPVRDFAQCFHPTIEMIEARKFTDNRNAEIPHFNLVRDSSYHLDAKKFGEFLRDKMCLPNGTAHIVDNVSEIKLSESGHIEKIITEAGQEIVADLFIDCTGFRSVLLEQTMDVAFESYGDKLLNDRALAVHIQYADRHREMELCTNCTALGNGWVWNIPLYHRIGSGYVYSSQFIDDEQAETDYVDHLTKKFGPERSKDLSFNRIRIKHGQHEKAWVKNCVAIGLSYGFVEPLESIGLASTHELIEKFSDVLVKGFYTKYDIDSFNKMCYQTLKGYHNFVSCHYATANRDDTAYWRHVQNDIDWIDIHETLEDERPLTRYSEHWFNAARSSENHFRHLNTILPGVYYIMTGSEYLPIRNVDQFLRNLATMTNPDEELKNIRAAIGRTCEYWSKKHRYLEEVVAKLPSQYQWLTDNIYNQAGFAESDVTNTGAVSRPVRA